MIITTWNTIDAIETVPLFQLHLCKQYAVLDYIIINFTSYSNVNFLSSRCSYKSAKTPNQISILHFTWHIVLSKFQSFVSYFFRNSISSVINMTSTWTTQNERNLYESTSTIVDKFMYICLSGEAVQSRQSSQVT